MERGDEGCWWQWEWAGYPPNTKNVNVFAFFMFRPRIIAEHEKCATNGVFFMFGRWEGGYYWLWEGEGRSRIPTEHEKRAICGTFFVFGPRIAAEHGKCATNGAFLVFGRWKGGGETGRGCWWLQEGARYPLNMKNTNVFAFFMFG